MTHYRDSHQSSCNWGGNLTQQRRANSTTLIVLFDFAHSPALRRRSARGTVEQQSDPGLQGVGSALRCDALNGNVIERVSRLICNRDITVTTNIVKCQWRRNRPCNPHGLCVVSEQVTYCIKPESFIKLHKLVQVILHFIMQFRNAIYKR